MIRKHRQRIGGLLVIVATLVVLPAFGGVVALGTGTVQTSGEAPLLTKTGTLRFDNREDGIIENVRATLQAAEADPYTIVDSDVQLARLEAGATVESTDTFAVQVDLSAIRTRNVPLNWLLEFDLEGVHHQVSLRTILEVSEKE
jgi:hypothetical protein